MSAVKRLVRRLAVDLWEGEKAGLNTIADFIVGHALGIVFVGWVAILWALFR